MDISQLNLLIQKRRSVFPPSFNTKKIEKKAIEQIVENANWAPTHKMTEPWRFKIIRGQALKRLSVFMVNDFKNNAPIEKQNESKIKKTEQSPLQSSCVIAICMQTHAGIPEWEEIAAVAMAVQNMWLSCTALGIGSYWSTPGSILRMGNFLNLAQGEKCLGLFYMGYSDTPLHKGKRSTIEDKVVWIEE